MPFSEKNTWNRSYIASVQLPPRPRRTKNFPSLATMVASLAFDMPACAQYASASAMSWSWRLMMSRTAVIGRNIAVNVPHMSTVNIPHAFWGG